MDIEGEGQEAELSIRDELAAALDAGENAIPDAPLAPAVPAAPEGNDQAQRVRDEAGKFAKAPETGQASPELKTPQAGAEPGATQAITPPAAWSATAKADFGKLPPHIQQEVAKREKDWNDGLAQRQQEAERFNRLDSILAPRRDQYMVRGFDDTRRVQQLVAAEEFLEKDPYRAIAILAQGAGVDLTRFAQGVPGGQAAQPPMPPQFQQLAQQVNTLQGAWTQQQQQAAQAAQSQTLTQIESFAADPKNIYFENVRADMGKLIQSGQASDLQDAYDKATWASPEIRPILLQQQQEAASTGAQQAARAKAIAARQASGSVTGSPAPGSSPANGGPAPTLRDELERAFDEVS